MPKFYGWECGYLIVLILMFNGPDFHCFILGFQVFVNLMNIVLAGRHLLYKARYFFE